uniref:Uncharacterized protein n=1 Tax=viral metagenome TaxID=1070528 RepID=A0A6H1Z8Y3_9ZZZZ
MSRQGKTYSLPFDGAEKPPAIISMCCLGIPCQYKPGRHIKKDRIAWLMERYTLIPICPEQLGGLPTPRPACHLSGYYVIGRDGEDYTAAYKRGAELTLDVCNFFGAGRAFMKRLSPSCDSVRGITALFLRGAGIRVLGV